MIDKKALSERDICTKFITPAVEKSGWNKLTQLLEEVSFTDGKIYVRGKLTARGNQKRADYILYYKPNIPIAIIEAKDNKHSVRAGIQQALDYARILDIPCVFSSNGDGFLFHDRTATDDNIETEIGLENFPTPEQLWEKYKKYKGITTPTAEKKLKKEKELPPIKPEEIPFEIPENCVWCRLGEMSINLDGQRIPVSESEKERKEKIYNYY